MSTAPGPVTYSITNPGPQDATINPGSGEFILGAGRTWTTTDPCAFWRALNSVKVGGVPASISVPPYSYAELQSQFRNCSVTGPTLGPSPTTGYSGYINAPTIPTPPMGQISHPLEPLNIPGKPVPGRSEEQSNQKMVAGEPVDLFSGQFYIHEVDISVPDSLIDLSLERTYLSGFPLLGPFGWNWDHNHNQYLRILDNGDIARWNGKFHEDIFRVVGTSYEPPRGIFENLIGSNPNFAIQARSGHTYQFGYQSGITDTSKIPLLWQEDRFGNRLTYLYENGLQGKVRVKIVNATSNRRFFRFYYGECGLLEKIEDRWDDGTTTIDNGVQIPLGQLLRSVYYDHDPDIEHLARVRKYPDGEQEAANFEVYMYGDVADDPNLVHNITMVADAKDPIYTINVYERDPSSPNYTRVVKQYFGDFVYEFDYQELQLVPPADAYTPSRPEYVNYPSRRTLVRFPDGAISVFTFNYRGDAIDHRMQLTKSGIVQVIVNATTFDVEGNPIEEVKPSGLNIQKTFPFISSSDYRLRGLYTQITEVKPFNLGSRTVWQGTFDTTGAGFQNLLSIKDERENETTYTYTANKKALVTIAYPVVKLPDDPTLQIAVESFSFDATLGVLLSHTSGEGRVESFEYGNNTNNKGTYRRKVKRTRLLTANPTGPKIEEFYNYDGIGYPSAYTNGAGETVTFQYYLFGNLKLTTLPAINGTPATIERLYDNNGNLIQIKKPKGQYDGVGVDTFISDLFYRDVLGHVSKSIVGSNSIEPYVIERSLDYRGLTLAERRPDSSYQVSAYDERGLLLTQQTLGADGTADMLSCRYDVMGRKTGEIFGPAQDIFTVFSYDEYGRQTVVSEQGKVDGVASTKRETRFYFSWTDQIPNQSPWNAPPLRPRPADNSWIGAKNLVILKEVIEDPAGLNKLLTREFFEYDARDRLVLCKTYEFNILTPAVPKYLDTKYTYDKDSNLIKERGPQVTGGVFQDTTYTYDKVNRLTETADPISNKIIKAYDNASRLVSETKDDVVPGGRVTRTWQFSYDDRGRQTELIEPNAIATIVEYDDRDLKVKMTDPLGKEIAMKYNLLGSVVQEVRDQPGLNIENEWEYDSMNRIAKYTDPTSQVTTYSYDGLSRRKIITYPDGASQTNIYSADGRLQMQSYASKAVLNFSYDRFGRIATTSGVAKESGTNSIPQHTFTYDGLDRVTTASVSGGASISRTYDSLGRLTQESNGGVTLSIIRETLTGIHYRNWAPDNRREQLTLDLNGVATSIARTIQGALGNDNSSLVNTLQLSGSRLLAQCNLFGGLQLIAEYDDRYRLQTWKYKNGGVDLEREDYQYDNASRMRIENISPTLPQSRLHSFDSKWRLTVTDEGFNPPISVGAGGSQSIQNTTIQAYESAVGTAATHYGLVFSPALAPNDAKADARTKYTKTGQADISYSYNTGHRPAAAGADSITTFIDGAIKAVGAQAYQADLLGRTTNVDADFTITYDGFGRPSSITSGASTRQLYYFGNELWQENVSGAINRQYSHHELMHGALAIHVSGNTYVSLNDGRSNRTGISNSAGSVVERYRYEMFGATTSGSGVGLEPWFGGMRYIANKGLYLGRFRMYKPSVGLWLAPDPKGYIDSPNLYAYVAQNPINFNDRSGLSLRLGTKNPVPGSSTPAFDFLSPAGLTVTPSGVDNSNLRNQTIRAVDFDKLRGVFMLIGFGSDKYEERYRFVRQVYPRANSYYLSQMATGHFEFPVFSTSYKILFDQLTLYPDLSVRDQWLKSLTATWWTNWGEDASAWSTYLGGVPLEYYENRFDKLSAISRQNFRWNVQKGYTKPMTVSEFRELNKAKALKLKVAGGVLSVGALAVEWGGIYDDWNSDNPVDQKYLTERTTRASVNTVVTAIGALGGPVGWGVALTWGAIDLIWGDEIYGIED